MSVFLDKVAQRLDKLDSADRLRQFRQLADEIGFFESVFDTLKEGVLVVSPEGELLYANNAAEALTGSPCSKTRGKPVRKAIPGWDWGNLLRPARDGWSRASAQELEVLYPEHRILEINAMPSRNGTVLLVRDVTLARAREESARETSRTDAVRDLAAGVAHEIGNPLNAISLNLQLLAREFRREPDADRRERLLHDISTAQNEVKRLEGIIKGFLSALRPAKLNLVPGSLVEPLTDTLDAMKAQFEDRRIKTALNLPTALPTVLVDRAQMEQVFFNLIKNALEAMKDGGSLDIDVESDDRDVRVVFSDNGSGMDAATLAHIFEPYQTSKEHGSGLGLMLSRRIVHAHGGEIDVESKPGAGTVFTVRIPRLEKRVRRLK
ncbi:MAG: PAS domain-containing protein [Kiritimatiellae bacterium]|nr:PAS domain-containing protein [Kiritimatiellia bacterium]